LKARLSGGLAVGVDHQSVPTLPGFKPPRSSPPSCCTPVSRARWRRQPLCSGRRRNRCRGAPPEEAGIWLTLGDVAAWRRLRPTWEEVFDRASTLPADAGHHVGVAQATAFRGGWLHRALRHPRERP